MFVPLPKFFIAGYGEKNAEDTESQGDSQHSDYTAQAGF